MEEEKKQGKPECPCNDRKNLMTYTECYDLYLKNGCPLVLKMKDEEEKKEDPPLLLGGEMRVEAEVMKEVAEKIVDEKTECYATIEKEDGTVTRLYDPLPEGFWELMNKLEYNPVMIPKGCLPFSFLWIKDESTWKAALTALGKVTGKWDGKDVEKFLEQVGE